MSRDAGFSGVGAERAWMRSLCGLGTALTAAAVVAAPATAQNRVTLEARADSDVQGGAPDENYGHHALIHVGNPDKTVFVYFDLSQIPAGATITRAELLMSVAASSGPNPGPNSVAVGGVQARWRESEITFANQPSVT